MKYIIKIENFKFNDKLNKEFEQLQDRSKKTELVIDRRNLDELNHLSEYTNLKKLYFDTDHITSLPELPKKLKKLHCIGNQLTSLPELPDTLEELICGMNNLTSLPELPKKFKTLYCQNNQLTSLPELPESLTDLCCYKNHLPFNDLTEYKEWYEQNKDIIETEGLEYAYEFYNQINKYNI